MNENPAAPSAVDAAFQEAYEHLRNLARQMLQQQRPGHTLQATALVHEVYCKLLSTRDSAIHDRGRFYPLAATAMRNLLIDHARTRHRQKRGGRIERLPVDALQLASQGADDEILAVDEAIEVLRGQDPRLAELVRVRFFAGLTVEEIAVARGESERTTYRDWRYAKTMLLTTLRAAGR